MEWKETYIRILNQQKLPDVTEYAELETKEDVFDAIVTLKVRRPGHRYNRGVRTRALRQVI